MTFDVVRKLLSVSLGHHPPPEFMTGKNSADMLDLLQEQSRLLKEQSRILQAQSHKLDSFQELLSSLLDSPDRKKMKGKRLCEGWFL
jgi:hypothetical protein